MIYSKNQRFQHTGIPDTKITEHKAKRATRIATIFSLFFFSFSSSLNSDFRKNQISICFFQRKIDSIKRIYFVGIQKKTGQKTF